MKNYIDNKIAFALCDGRFLVNVNNLVSNPSRTGVQRVCYEFWQRWPYRESSIPFVEINKNTIGLLDPEVLDDIKNLFESNDPVLEQYASRHRSVRIEPNSGWMGLFAARNRIIAKVKIKPALDVCRGVIALEESLNLDFFNEAAEYRPDKILHLCHDFLVWTHSEFFNIDWNSADNISQSLVNRRKYRNNFFTSTMTRDVYTDKINPGDTRHYWVIPPGADAFGRSYRSEIPKSNEFVVVGTLEPRKQPVQILEAFEAINKNGVKAELCFAGRMGWLKPADKEKLQKAFRTYPWVRWVDGPDDGELRALMQSARASIYMSVAEGFGSPPVESLALGVPCIVSDTVPSVVDMQSNGQRRVSPHDKAGLIAAINDLLDDTVLSELQREIETLELPTWKAFVEGIAQMADERVPAKLGALEPISYREMLAVLEVCKHFRELPRDSVIYRLSTIAKLPSDQIADLIEEGKRRQWNNIDTLLNLSQRLGERVLKPEFVSAAITSTIDVVDLPLSDDSEWKQTFDRLLSVRDPEAFVRRVYSDIHCRGFGEEEVRGQLPYRVEDFSHISKIISSLKSDEFDKKLVEKVISDSDDRYFDRIEVKSKDNLIQYLKSNYFRFEVSRSVYIENDKDYVSSLYNKLTGQIIGKEDLRKWTGRAESLVGRYEVALEMLMLRESILRSSDAGIHNDLIGDLARRSGHYGAPKATALVMLGRLQKAKMGLLSSAAVLKTITGRPFGFFPGEALDVLDEVAKPEAKVAIAVVWAMLNGYAVWSSKLLDWAQEQIALDRDLSRDHGARVHRNGTAAFAAFYGRRPDNVEMSILSDASSAGVSVPSALVASLRLEQNPDVLGAVKYVLANKDVFGTKADDIEGFAQELIDICPPPASYDLKPRPQGGALLGSTDHQSAADDNVLGDMTSVDELMTLSGEAFISAAYRKILLRNADDSGMATYLKALSNSRGKPGVIYSLATSEEGRSKNVNLRGLEQLLRDYKPKPKKKKFGLKKVIRFFSSKGSKVGN